VNFSLPDASSSGESAPVRKGTTLAIVRVEEGGEEEISQGRPIGRPWAKAYPVKATVARMSSARGEDMSAHVAPNRRPGSAGSGAQKSLKMIPSMPSQL
jgi:hypothetical protein